MHSAVAPGFRQFKKMFSHKVIANCFGQDYLTRWYFLRGKWGSVMLHFFHRSDEDRGLHDHPWSFITLILWRGYHEVTPQGRKRKWPGMILFRRAEWRHRVELINEKPAVTLVLHFRRRRKWGYVTKEGWIEHGEWWNNQGCG